MKKIIYNSIIIIFSIFLLFSCITNKNKEEEESNKDYFHLIDILRELNIEEQSFINMAKGQNKTSASLLKNTDEIDHISEALVNIYFSENKDFTENQKKIFNYYFPKNSEKSVYKIISEILKSRVETKEIEKTGTFVNTLKYIEKKSKIKLINDSNAEKDILILENNVLEYYKEYIGIKIDVVAKREFTKLKKNFPISNAQIQEISNLCKKFYLEPKNNGYKNIVIGGAIVHILGNKRGREGTKPYMCIWNAYSTYVKELTTDEFYNSWYSEVKLLAETEGNKLFDKAKNGELKKEMMAD